MLYLIIHNKYIECELCELYFLYQINNNIDVLCGAGIMTAEDVSIALELGSKGILIASGIIQSNDWKNKIIELATPMKNYL